jgi:transposase|tara:strand:+ start:144 stop:476 length:333 start_codon:yes stop_codon:yes gene_type:complete
MSKQYDDESRAEAVRQVIDRGYSFNDVSKRLGVSAQSLYKLVVAASPTRENELERENLRLKAELRRAQEDLDIQKKPPRPFPKSKGEVRVHFGAQEPLVGKAALPPSGGH